LRLVPPRVIGHDRKERWRVAAADVLTRWPFRRAALRVARAVGSPTMHELSQVGQLAPSLDEAGIVLALPVIGDDHPVLTAARQSIRRRGEVHARRPPFMQVESNTERLLVSAVLALKPPLVLEIGVADGRSSAVLLAALREVGFGRLVSVDIDPDVGGLVEDRTGWDLRIHDARRADLALMELVAELGDVQMVFHDGRHDYAGQMRDYRTLLSHVAPGGLFITDDVDHSYAFIDLCTDLGRPPVILSETRKAIGAFRM
jgi:predicted O-methyltransferase YrrM